MVPLIAFFMMIAYLQLHNIKKLSINRSLYAIIKSPNPIVTARNEINEMHQCEHDVIVDQKLRDKSTAI